MAFHDNKVFCTFIAENKAAISLSNGYEKYGLTPNY